MAAHKIHFKYVVHETRSGANATVVTAVGVPGTFAWGSILMNDNVVRATESVTSTLLGKSTGFGAVTQQAGIGGGILSFTKVTFGDGLEVQRVHLHSHGHLRRAEPALRGHHVGRHRQVPRLQRLRRLQQWLDNWCPCTPPCLMCTSRASEQRPLQYSISPSGNNTVYIGEIRSYSFRGVIFSFDEDIKQSSLILVILDQLWIMIFTIFMINEIGVKCFKQHCRLLDAC